MSVEDSIRLWFSWQHDKVVFVPDPLQSTWDGGETPWYIYRSAEVYLLLAESYYWKNDLGLATLAIKEVRQCAGAAPLTDGDVNIGEIFDERARKLYYEENRHIKLLRVAYIYAKTRKPCKFLVAVSTISIESVYIIYYVQYQRIPLIQILKELLTKMSVILGRKKNKTPLLVEDK